MNRKASRAVLTVTNAHHASAMETEIAVRGSKNTKAVEPTSAPVTGGGAQLLCAFAPASVTEYTIG